MIVVINIDIRCTILWTIYNIPRREAALELVGDPEELDLDLDLEGDLDAEDRDSLSPINIFMLHIT